MDDHPLRYDDFDICMERLGYPRNSFSYQPVEGDRKVIGQRWETVAPYGSRFAADNFYSHFGKNKFRKVLRYLFEHRSCFFDELQNLNITKQTLEQYVAYLVTQNIAVQEENKLMMSSRYLDISGLGATLEWYVAEWFRLGLEAPARHGVHLVGMTEGGDLDVVAFLREKPILVECKSGNPKNITDEQLHLFLQRVVLFKPAVALLLVDTESKIDSLFDKLKKVYATSTIVGPGNTSGVSLDVSCIHVCNVKKSLIDSLYATLESHSSGDPGDRPLLSLTPHALSRIIGILPGLTKDDSIVMKLACEKAVEANNKWVNIAFLREQAALEGIAQENFVEAMDILEREHYIEPLDRITLKILIRGFEEYARVYVPKYAAMVQEVASLIITSEPMNDHRPLFSSLSYPPRILMHILEYLESEGFFQLRQMFGGKFRIDNVSSALKRTIREGKEL